MQKESEERIAFLSSASGGERGDDECGGNDRFAITGVAGYRNDRTGDTSRRSRRNITKKVTRGTASFRGHFFIV